MRPFFFFLRILFLFVLSVGLIRPLLASADSTYTLDEVLKQVRASNPVLQKEKYNMQIAEADIIGAKLRPNPILNNQTLQLMDRDAAIPGGGNTKHPVFSNFNRQVWYQLTKPVQIFGQRIRKIDYAKKQNLVASKTYQELERNIFFEVATKWLEIWGVQKQVELIQVAKNNIESLVAINKLRYEKKMITETEVFRAELLEKQYSSQYQISLQDEENKQRELGFLLGVPSRVQVDSADMFPYDFTGSLDSLLRTSLNTRTDVLVGKSAVEAAQSNIALQKSLAYPVPEVGFIYNPQNSVPYFGIFATITLPVLNRNQGEIKKSYLYKTQAERSLTMTENLVSTEIKNAYRTYQVHKQNIEKYRAILSQSESILQNVRYAYLKGATSIIDFLEAQRSWVSTQQQFYELMLAYRKSYITLLFASGLINRLAE